MGDFDPKVQFRRGAVAATVHQAPGAPYRLKPWGREAVRREQDPSFLE
jgi:uncharacterized protein YjhX (UPF0386 family)